MVTNPFSNMVSLVEISGRSRTVCILRIEPNRCETRPSI
jgi:hypothetical protein